MPKERKEEMLAQIPVKVDRGDDYAVASFRCPNPECKKWHPISMIGTAFLDYKGVKEKWHQFITDCISSMVSEHSGAEVSKAKIIDVKDLN